MSSQHHIFDRATLINEIAKASMWGYLGLFVGTGFSNAMTKGKAPSFIGLIQGLIKRFNLAVDIQNDSRCRFKSLPQIASELVRMLQEKSRVPEREPQQFRQEIAHLCNLTPDSILAKTVAEALQRLQPSWVMTTNYDLILEALLENGVSVLPDQPLVPRPDRVPIYHLHGHRLSPVSIKITEEDYVGLVGPIDYQRLKLPLVLLESTTVMLGYALGDINVRAAIAWSKSFGGKGGVRLSGAQGLVIQALYNPTDPKPEPYDGPDGELIIQIADIPEFLKELADGREVVNRQLNEMSEEINKFLSDPKKSESIATPGQDRETFLLILENALPFSQPTRVIDFLTRALDPIWKKARKNGGFEFYNVFLKLLIEVLERVKPADCNPSLVRFLAEVLDSVGYYIDPQKQLGSAIAATDTWIANHSKLALELKGELQSHADNNNLVGLKKLLSIANNQNSPSS